MSQKPKLWLAATIVALAMTAFLAYAAQPKEELKTQVSFLKNLRPYATSQSYIAIDKIMEAQTFLVARDFATLDAIAKRELVSDAQARAYRIPNCTATLLLMRKDTGSTIVWMGVTRKTTWLDRAAYWIKSLLNRKISPDVS